MANTTEIWRNSVLIAAGGDQTSPWFNVEDFDKLTISRESAGGTYEFEIEWTAGPEHTVDVTDTLEFPANDDIISEDVTGKMARFRIKNTAGTPFTSHSTVVNGRQEE